MSAKQRHLLAVMVGICAATSSALPAQEPIPVRTARVEQIAVSLMGSAPATVVSLNRTVVAAQVTGIVNTIPVNVGQVVYHGTLLAELDCADHQQSLQQTRSSLKALDARKRLAEQQLDRAQRLLPTGNISEEQVNQRQAEYDMVQAEITAQNATILIARRHVSKCRIDSPFDGVVTKRLSNQGAFVSPGTPIVEVVDTRRLEVSAKLNLDLAESLPATGLLFVSREKHYPLALNTILPVVDVGSRSREARLTFTGIQALAGTPGRLVWTAAAMAIPAHLLVSRDDQLGVFVAEGNIAVFKPIDGALQGRPAPVTFSSDTRLITDGRHGLQHNDPIADSTVD